MPAISEARLNANRRNAQQSTGPRTPEGKAKASLNAVRHALTGRRVTSLDESPDAFEVVRRQLVDEWRPASVMELALVDQIAELLWRGRRVASVEAAMLDPQKQQSVFTGKWFQPPHDVTETMHREFRNERSAILRLQLYQMRIDRALHRALAELRRLQVDRKSRDESPVSESDAFDLDSGYDDASENEKTNPPVKMTVSGVGRAEEEEAEADVLIGEIGNRACEAASGVHSRGGAGRSFESAVVDKRGAAGTMSCVQVRQPTLDDARRIAEIHVDAWQKAYRGIMPGALLDTLDVNKREQKWRVHIEERTERTLVAEDDGGRVVGWATFGRCKCVDAKDTDGEVYGIYLDPAVWRQGIGRTLWTEAITSLAQMNFDRAAVWVLTQNEAARRFYEAMGGAPDGREPTPYIRDGFTLTKVRYWCPLVPPFGPQAVTLQSLS